MRVKLQQAVEIRVSKPAYFGPRSIAVDVYVTDNEQDIRDTSGWPHLVAARLHNVMQGQYIAYRGHHSHANMSVMQPAFDRLWKDMTSVTTRSVGYDASRSLLHGYSVFRDDGEQNNCQTKVDAQLD